MESKNEIIKEKDDQQKQVDNLEKEAHDDKLKDDVKNTDDRQKDIDDDTAKADVDEQSEKYEKRFIEFDDKLKDLEKRIIELSKDHAARVEKEKQEIENNNRELIGYGYN